MNRKWKDGSLLNEFLYYNEEGRIVGDVGRVGVNNCKNYATVYSTLNNESKGLGHYISIDHAKKAVEKFWDIQDRILIESDNHYE